MLITMEKEISKVSLSLPCWSEFDNLVYGSKSIFKYNCQNNFNFLKTRWPNVSFICVIDHTLKPSAIILQLILQGLVTSRALANCVQILETGLLLIHLQNYRYVCPLSLFYESQGKLWNQTKIVRFHHFQKPVNYFTKE